MPMYRPNFKKMANCVVIATLVLVINLSPLRADHTATLQELLDGGSLLLGDNTYNSFQILQDVGTVSADYTLIDVIAIASGLEFAGNGQFSVNSEFDSLILQVGFDAGTTGSLFGLTAADLNSGNPIVPTNGLIDLFNTFDVMGNTVSQTNAFVDPSFGVSQFYDQQSILRVSQISGSTSLSIFGDSTGVVSLASYRVGLAVPEPATTSLLFVVGAAVISRRRR